MREETEFDELCKLKEDARLVLSKCDSKRRMEEGKYAVCQKAIANLPEDWKNMRNDLANARAMEKMMWDGLVHTHQHSMQLAQKIRGMLDAKTEETVLGPAIDKLVEEFQDASKDAVDAENKGRATSLKAVREGKRYEQLAAREKDLEMEHAELTETVRQAREAQLRAQQTVDGLKAIIDSLPSFGLSPS